MKTDDFDYILPETLIAQTPSPERGQSRMLVMSRESGMCRTAMFPEIVDLLHPDDLLVLNDTAVIHARLYGRKNGIPEGAHTEFLLLSPLTHDFSQWQAYAKPAKRIPPGTRIRLLGHNHNFTEPEAWVETLARNSDGSMNIRLEVKGDLFDFLAVHGNLPLPPYITREATEEDETRYQTVFAALPGAVAAPTAGLHFTDEILNQLRTKGIETAAITLHTGAGTFKPVTVDDVEKHIMHTENFIISPETAEAVNRAKREGRRIIAVGTTSVRAMESACDEMGFLSPCHRSTDIFIYPPYQPKVANGLLTNFHLPKSTLMMLVSAYSSREKILNAYRIAVEEQFRFYSYGDCMLILPES